MRYEYSYHFTADLAECAIEQMLNSGEIDEKQEPDIRQITSVCYAVTLNDQKKENEQWNGE
jgi:hypothetical protein